ncbi:MAG: hypothetical protein IT435_01435 [Phycisphaerales bacterium]|nr:hypothetical protein [Phycisphaerales bacterium]
MRTSHNGRHSTKRTSDPIATLGGDIAAIKRDIGMLIGVGAGNVASRAREAVSRMGESAGEFKDRAAEQYEAAHEKLSASAAKRPVTTILVSMAAGLVVGKVSGADGPGTRS